MQEPITACKPGTKSSLEGMVKLLYYTVVVVETEIPRDRQTPAQAEEVNCKPLSEMRAERTKGVIIFVFCTSSGATGTW